RWAFGDGATALGHVVTHRYTRGDVPADGLWLLQPAAAVVPLRSGAGAHRPPRPGGAGQPELLCRAGGQLRLVRPWVGVRRSTCPPPPLPTRTAVEATAPVRARCISTITTTATPL